MVIIFILLFGSVIGFNLYKQERIADYLANRPEKVFPVTAIEIKSEDWSPVLSAIGFLNPESGVTLTNEDAGVVTLLNFKSGQPIKKGDVLLELDQSVEKANLETSEAKLPATKASFERKKKLFKKGTISKEAYDQANSDYQSLLAQIKSSKAVIARRTVTAPFAGISGLRLVDLGQYLQPGTEIVRLEKISEMRVRFTLPQNVYNELYVDQPVKLYVNAHPNHAFTGVIDAIAPVVNPDSGIFNVQAVINNPEAKLRSGMFANVEIELEQQHDKIFVPTTAISYQLYGNSIYVIEPLQSKKGDKQEGQENFVVKRVSVSLGSQAGDRVLIKSGLSVGQRVVTSGQVRLSNGSHVKIVDSNVLRKPDSLPQL